MIYDLRELIRPNENTSLAMFLAPENIFAKFRNPKVQATFTFDLNRIQDAGSDKFTESRAV